MLATNGSTQLYRYDIDNNEFFGATIKYKESSAPGFCFPIKGEKDLFMVGLDRSVYIVKWDGCSCEAYKIKKLFCIQNEFDDHGIDTAKCDPTGRLYVGTYNFNICDKEEPFNRGLYSYDRYQGLQKRISGLKVPDGMAWSVKENYFYFIDACSFNIRRFRWNSKTGKLCK